MVWGLYKAVRLFSRNMGTFEGIGLSTLPEKKHRKTALLMWDGLGRENSEGGGTLFSFLNAFRIIPSPRVLFLPRWLINLRENGKGCELSLRRTSWGAHRQMLAPGRVIYEEIPASSTTLAWPLVGHERRLKIELLFSDGCKLDEHGRGIQRRKTEQTRQVIRLTI